MGMFNSILADLTCPVTGGVTPDAEIQINWQEPVARALQVYHTGDQLEHLCPRYDSTRVKTDYACDSCSRKTVGRDGLSCICAADQRWHCVFVEIRGGRIGRILTESEFQALANAAFVDDT
jgi:hypothetical protein